MAGGYPMKAEFFGRFVGGRARPTPQFRRAVAGGREGRHRSGEFRKSPMARATTGLFRLFQRRHGARWVNCGSM